MTVEPKQKKKRIIKQRQSLAEKERGTTIFPTARIKKIIKADKELEMMTAEAVFMIAVTTVSLASSRFASRQLLATATREGHDQVLISRVGILHQTLHGGRLDQSTDGQKEDCQL
jgi:hypothetical protein